MPMSPEQLTYARDLTHPDFTLSVPSEVKYILRLLLADREGFQTQSGADAAECRRLSRELDSAQKHFDAVLDERVIQSTAIDAALDVLRSNDPQVRNRVTLILEEASAEIERLGREYRGEPVSAN